MMPQTVVCLLRRTVPYPFATESRDPRPDRPQNAGDGV